MGWSWRRSTSLGPIRLSFSRSGIGISAGVRGARISTGPRGTYVNVGAGGFRYSYRLNDQPRQRPVQPRSAPPSPSGQPVARGQLVEIVESGRLVEADADELVEEIRRKANRLSLVSTVCVTGTLLLIAGLVGLTAEWEPRTALKVLVGSGIVAFLSIPWAIWWDRQSLISRVFYEFDPLGTTVHEGIVRIIEDLQRSDSVWSVRVEDRHGDWKRNAGAGVSVDRSPVQLGWGAPPRLLTNVRIGQMRISGTTLYFFPDRVLIFGSGGIQAVRYGDLTLEPTTVNFIEEGRVPGDAIRVSTTWKFVNRDGGPDRRFKENRQLAVMKYDVLNLSSAAGMRLKLHVSKAGLAEKSAKDLNFVQNAIEELKARGLPLESTRRSTADPGADLPPLVVPVRKAASLGVAAFEYRWLAALPEWFVPIIWGLIFVLPAVAGSIILARGSSIGTWCFMGAALLFAGAGIPVLARDRKRLLAEQAAEEIQERKNRFHELLREELRSKSARQVDFIALTTECGVTQQEADSVADEFYRRQLARVLVNSVITAEGRRKLRILANAMQIPSERCERLESEAGLIGSDEADPHASSLPPRPVATCLPEIPIDEPIIFPQLITLEEPAIPYRAQPTARMKAIPVPEFTMDLDPANAEAGISPELKSRERKPSLAMPIAPEAKDTPDAPGSEDPREKPIVNATVRVSSPTMRAPDSDFAGRGIGAKDHSEPVEVSRENRASDTGEAIPLQVPIDSTSQRFDLSRIPLESTRPLWSPPKNVEWPPDAAVLAWYGKGQNVTVGPYALVDPLVYVCNGQKSSSEASCIDHRHPIGKPVAEPVGSLGYYPEYSRLSGDQRANYLNWLAGGRTEPLSDIGYAFLYFYGLERRLLVDDQDLSPIVKEVVRLLETYTFSGSFDGYLSRFLSYTLARSGIGTLKEKWFQAVFERTRAQRDEQHLAVGLAWLFSNERPLPPGWACRIARLDPRSPRSVVLERLPDQFNALFLKRYKDRYGDGMKLTAAKRDREVSYQPASPSRSPYVSSTTELKPVKIPHVMGIQSQFEPLVKIWTSCVEELKPLSRVMAKGADVSNRAAYEALPDALKAETEHPDKVRWDQVAAEQAQEDGTVIVKIMTLAEIQGYAPKAKLTAKQSETMAQTAHAVGFMIEPDPRITNRAYGWEDHVVLFRPEDRPNLPQDHHFAGASLLLELGMFIAAADGEIEEQEVNHIASFLESQFLLDPTDARRLESLKRVFLKQHPSIAGIGKRLQKIANTQQIESIGQFLFGVAAVNGSIEKAEITALRSAYRALGIDPKSLDRQLAEFARLQKEPIEVVARQEPESLGEAIPAQNVVATRSLYVLDKSLIELLMRETDQVKTILGDAMGDDEATYERETIPPPLPEPPGPELRFEGLDGRYSAVLVLLCDRASWSRSEFDELVRCRSLMPSGTLDKINEWAYDRFDDPILEEDGDSIHVHLHLVVEPS
jgi:uncharacterized tellurite resistance protein B-like protein